jgi:4-amino-4-deoxy-L-arabinose transferase-like glycosyltransferase
LLLLYTLCQRYFTRRTALIACGLFILCPPLFTRFNLITMGFHSESILFTLASLLFLYDMLFHGRREPWRRLLLGLLLGFGVWFTPTVGITVLTCACAWLLFTPAFFRERGFWVVLGGFVVGLAPWIVFNATHEWGGLQTFVRPILTQDLPAPLPIRFQKDRDER